VHEGIKRRAARFEGRYDDDVRMALFLDEPRSPRSVDRSGLPSASNATFLHHQQIRVIPAFVFLSHS
jgi:hypothetical protein